MAAPIFKVCAAAPGVTALLGSLPTRLYPHGEAPEGVAKPYAVWQVISGSPLSFVSGRPQDDRYGLQVDVYADTATAADQVATAIQYAIERQSYITSFNGAPRDPVTKNYRNSFDVAWLVTR
jgi:hypothetical protein